MSKITVVIFSKNIICIENFFKILNQNDHVKLWSSKKKTAMFFHTPKCNKFLEITKSVFKNLREVL